MNAKELGNVLCKLLGLSLCVREVGPLSTVLFDLTHGSGGYPFTSRSGAYAVSVLLTIGVGAFLILKSRGVTEFLFKSDTE